MHPVANFIAFQAGWFAIVLSAAAGRPWLGLPVVLTVLALHLLAVARPRREASLLAIAVLLGLVVDSLLLSGGWLAYASGLWLPGLAPWWILALWPLFATTLNVSLRWLQGRWLLSAALGAVGGPLSYFAGARLGAVDIAAGLEPLLVLGLAWALATPLLSWVAARLDGVHTGPLPRSIRNWVGDA